MFLNPESSIVALLTVKRQPTGVQKGVTFLRTHSWIHQTPFDAPPMSQLRLCPQAADPSGPKTAYARAAANKGVNAMNEVALEFVQDASRDTGVPPLYFVPWKADDRSVPPSVSGDSVPLNPAFGN